LGLDAVDALIADLRFAVRTLTRSPGFTLVAVLTLALGIGAANAIFSVVSAVLLRPLPYPHADRIALIWGTRGGGQESAVSIPALRDWMEQNHSFAAIGVARMQSVNLTGTEEPDRLTGNFVTAATLRVLGARAALGRLFSPAETAEGTGQNVAVISWAAWKTRFGGDPAIIGRTIVLNGRPHVVIGVTDPGFTDTFGPIDVWLPITSAPNATWFTRADPEVWGVGRLKPGVSMDAARRDLSAVAARLAAQYPATDGGSGALVAPLRDEIVGPVRPALLVLLAFVGVVLLIACANVASLQLVRAAARDRELSVRATLGAGRARLARQLLTESLVLAVAGGALGLLLARWLVAGLVAIAPPGFADYASGRGVSLDLRVLLFAVVIAAGAGLLFGTAPALHAGRADLTGALKLRSAGGREGVALRLRRGVVGFQVALAIVLLVGAGLLARSLGALGRVDPGFDPARLLTAEFRLPSAKYRTPEQIADFMTRATAAIRAVPGVQRAALIRSVPLSGNWGSVGFVPDTRPELTTAEAPTAQENDASDGFIRAMGMRLVAGRGFEASDRLGAAPVAIVDEELARRTWPNTSPLGRRLKILGPPDQWVTVVGVVGDVRQLTLKEPPVAQIYLPMAQQPGIFASVVARTSGDPMALAKAVRAAIWTVDPEQPVWKLRSMASLLARDAAMPRFTVVLTAAFALLALLLAAIGVYGVMSYAVAQRTHEVGIRMALGAEPRQVVGSVLERGLRIVLGGALFGMVGALGAAQLLRHQLFGVGAADPVVFAAAPATLVAVALVACWLPARRAARVDPVVALRSE
jgi:putative ABC transport system permease protein